IISSTDAPAVFSVLRARSLRLKGYLGSLLEFESGSNDPMAVFLTLGITALIMDSSQGAGSFFLSLILQFSVGGIAGYLVGEAAALAINRVNLEYEGLYPTLTFATALISFSG